MSIQATDDTNANQVIKTLIDRSDADADEALLCLINEQSITTLTDIIENFSSTGDLDTRIKHLSCLIPKYREMEDNIANLEYSTMQMRKSMKYPRAGILR